MHDIINNKVKKVFQKGQEKMIDEINEVKKSLKENEKSYFLAYKRIKNIIQEENKRIIDKVIQVENSKLDDL